MNPRDTRSFTVKIPIPVHSRISLATTSRECYREVKKGGNCDWKGVLLSAGAAYLELGAPGLGKFIEKAGSAIAPRDWGIFLHLERPEFS
jgi:hypothetical protein